MEVLDYQEEDFEEWLEYLADCAGKVTDPYILALQTPLVSMLREVRSGALGRESQPGDSLCGRPGRRLRGGTATRRRRTSTTPSSSRSCSVSGFSSLSILLRPFSSLQRPFLLAFSAPPGSDTRR